jgi:hypothetical protein
VRDYIPRVLVNVVELWDVSRVRFATAARGGCDDKREEAAKSCDCLYRYATADPKYEGQR